MTEWNGCKRDLNLACRAKYSLSGPIGKKKIANPCSRPSFSMIVGVSYNESTDCSELQLHDFPGDQWLRIRLPMQGTSLITSPGTFHMP